MHSKHWEYILNSFDNFRSTLSPHSATQPTLGIEPHIQQPGIKRWQQVNLLLYNCSQYWVWWRGSSAMARKGITLGDNLLEDSQIPRTLELRMELWAVVVRKVSGGGVRSRGAARRWGFQGWMWLEKFTLEYRFPRVSGAGGKAGEDGGS